MAQGWHNQSWARALFMAFGLFYCAASFRSLGPRRRTPATISLAMMFAPPRYSATFLGYSIWRVRAQRGKYCMYKVHTSTCGTSSYVQIKNIKRLRYGDWHHFAKEDHACHLDFLILRTSTSSMKSSYDLTLFFFTGMTLSLHKSEGKLRQYHKKGRKVI